MPRPRSWSDDDLRAAVQGSTSWKGVCEALGVRPGGKTFESLRAAADRLQLDYSSFYGGGRRESVEDRVTDASIAQAVTDASSWTDLAHRLGYTAPLRGPVRRRIEERVHQLALSTAHFRGRGYNGLDEMRRSDAFIGSATADPKRLRDAAIGLAVAWFAQRGCVVSVPLEAAAYDLVVEWQGGFHRVQVKTSCAASRSVTFTRSLYSRTAEGTPSGGRVTQSPYRPGEIDYFFVVLGTGEKYLLPYDVIGERVSAKLGERYAEFQVPA